MDCRVVVEAAVPVYDVETADEAVRIAISKTGEMLNPDLNYVEIEMGSRTSSQGEELPPAFIAADEALVALELEMTVFNVDRNEHASRIARKEIGQRLKNIPLKVLDVEDVTEELEEDEEEPEEDEEAPAEVPSEETPAEETPGEEGSGGERTDEDSGASDSEEGDVPDESAGDSPDESIDDTTSGDEADLLPEFDEMVDE